MVVQRAQFDRVSEKVFKSVNKLGLRETLYLDRYLDDAVVDHGSSQTEDRLARRKNTWDLKDRVKQLDSKKNKIGNVGSSTISRPACYETMAQFLEGIKSDQKEDEEPDIEVQDWVIENLRKEAEKEREKLTCKVSYYEKCLNVCLHVTVYEDRQKELQQSIDDTFDDWQNYPYRLQSVFIHRGDATRGHYWIYVYDFHFNVWRKYNDEYVTEVKDLKEIFDHAVATGAATPYYLVYVRADRAKELAESVCRQDDRPPVDSNEKGQGTSAQSGAEHPPEVEMTEPEGMTRMQEDPDEAGTHTSSFSIQGIKRKLEDTTFGFDD